MIPYKGSESKQKRPKGVTGFMVDCGGFPNLTTLEMLVQEVIPALKR